MTSVGALSSQELIVVTGKGGVGKSAVAAALGTLLAGAGRRTMLLEIDPRESLHNWLEAPPSGGDLLAVAPRLYLRHLEPRREMDDLVDHHLRIGPLVRRVLASPVYAHFADGAPGLKELAVLGHALRLVAGPPIKGAPPLDVEPLGSLRPRSLFAYPAGLGLGRLDPAGSEALRDCDAPLPPGGRSAHSPSSCRPRSSAASAPTISSRPPASTRSSE